MHQVITSPLLRQYASRLGVRGAHIELLTKLGSRTLFREVIDLAHFPAEPENQLSELWALWRGKRIQGTDPLETLGEGVSEQCIEDLLKALRAVTSVEP